MNKRVAIGIAAALAGLVVITTVGVLYARDDRRLGAFRSYAGGKFFIEIAGVKAGAVTGVEGCGIGSDVVQEQVGLDGVTRKHLAGVDYDACVVRVANDMDAAAYNWIKAMLGGNQTAKDVVIVETDYNLKERRRVRLVSALLTRVRFPDLDGSSKDAANIELEITPEVTQRSSATGTTTYSANVASKSTAKKWQASNFRLTVPGVDSQSVASISGFEATQGLGETSLGETRSPGAALRPLKLNDVVVKIPAERSGDYDTWFTNFVVQGNNGQPNEKSATLEYLTPDLKGVLFTLSFKGVGIFRSVDGPASSGSENKAWRHFSLYIEEAMLSGFGPSVGGTGALGGAGGQTTTTTTTTTTTPTTSNQAMPVEATITPVSGELLVDGETFTISDGVNEPTTFEFDLDGRAEWIPVKFSKEAPPQEIATAIVEAINSVPESLEIVAKPTETQIIQLRSERDAEAGEEKILEFVASEEFKVRDAEKEVEALAAPTELIAEPGAAEGEINLRWNAVEGALGYLVLFSTEPGSTEYIELDKSEGTELTVAGLKSGVEHFFVVRALDGTNVSKNSNEAGAAPR